MTRHVDIWPVRLHPDEQARVLKAAGAMTKAFRRVGESMERAARVFAALPRMVRAMRPVQLVPPATQPPRGEGR